ncbi:MAG TPA: HD domain-containing protein [Clostridiaceae bacterium]|nr:HD domain-containing protein [Clostridiaceae bacterium]
MDRFNRILQDESFRAHVARIEEREKIRIFCHHDLAHFLDVARIAYILSLEENHQIEKELIYTAGILHDLGRWVEYDTGADHAVESRRIAEGFLEKYGYDREEKDLILSAIGNHRISDAARPFDALFYRADKLSRPCVVCPARPQCKKFQNGEMTFLKY